MTVPTRSLTPDQTRELIEVADAYLEKTWQVRGVEEERRRLIAILVKAHGG